MKNKINQPSPKGTDREGTGFKSLNIALLLTAVLVFSGLKTWAQPTLTGSETQVNTTTAKSQESPSIAMAPNGNAIVVWQSWANDGSSYGVYGQRFDNNGAALGTEFQVNTTTSSNQQSPDVDVDANGNFVITWMSQEQDGDGWGIYAQRYNAAGIAQGGEILVANSTAGNQKDPRISMAPNGNFVIAWADQALDGSGFGIFGRRFSAAGSPIAASFQVNTYTTGYQGLPDVACASNGAFAIVWQSLGQDGSDNGVYFQRYDANGATQGAETAVANTSLANQQAPTIGMDNSYNFVIAWTSYNQDGDSRGVYARRFDATGTAQGNEFQVNTTAAQAQDQVDVFVADNGHFVVAWSSYAQDGSYYGIYLQQYDASGVAVGGEVQANTRTTDFQQAPAGAWSTSNQNMLVVWMDGLHNSTASHDGEDYGIYLQGLGTGIVYTATAVCQDVTLYLDATGNASLLATDVDGGSTSNAPSWSLTVSQTSFDCSNVGTVQVDLILTVSPELSDTCTANVTVLDTTSPSITCPLSFTTATEPGVCTAVASYTPPSASDNCTLGAGAVQLTSGLGSGATFNSGGNTETWTVTDASGNTASCSFVISIQDAEAPAITCPANVSVATAPGTCAATVNYSQPTASDNCGAVPASSITMLSGLGSGGSFPKGVTTETWQAADGGGNTDFCSFTVTVLDQEAPAITCPANLSVGTSGGVCHAVVNYTAPTASDNCGSLAAGSITLTTGLGSGGAFPIGTNTETWTATDTDGNSSTCSFTISVSDQEAPVVTCPQNMVVPTLTGVCYGYVNYATPSVSDNCSANFQQGLIAWNGHYYKVNYNYTTFTDARNAAALQGGHLVTIGSQAENNFVQGLYGAGGGWIGLTDEVTEGLFQWVTGEPITYTNWAMYEPNNVGNEDYVQMGGNGQWNDLPNNLWGLPYITEFDGPVASLQLTSGINTPTYHYEGVYPTTWTATDAAGNSSSCSFTITVEDQQAPAITCPQDIVVNADPNICAALVGYAAPTATDNCTGAFDYNVFVLNGHYYKYDPTPRSFTDARNSAVAQGGYLVSVGSAAENAFIYNILKGNNGWLGINDEAVEGNFQWGNGEAVVYTNWGLNEPNDAGGVEDYGHMRWDGQWNDMPNAAVPMGSIIEFDGSIPSITFSSGTGSGNYFPVGTTVETWTATDKAGNTSNCSFNVTVVDNQAPMIFCQAPINITAPWGWPGYFVGYQVPGVWDNCGAGLAFTSGFGPGAFFPIGTHYETWTATDGSGNSTSCSVQINVFPGGFKANGSNDDTGGTAGSDGAEQTEAAGADESITEGLSEPEVTAFPNPFREGTTIRFRLHEDAEVQLDIYSMHGKLVASLFQGKASAGEEKEVQFQPESIPAGVYYYRLRTETEALKSGKLIYQR